MDTTFLISVAATSTVALIWRALLLDHPALLAAVERIPLVGGALRCGFCMALWLSLAAVLVHNPVAPYLAVPHPLLQLGVSWMAFSAAVLAMRNGIAVLIEACGVLTDLHRKSH